MFSTVLFSVTLAPTAAQFAPFSLSTSFCGSMNTTAVSVFWISMIGYPFWTAGYLTRRARKSRINGTISSALSSRAKWPVSSRWNSTSGRSRL